MSDDATRLASVERGSVVAAAGCGKTELIAKSVSKSSGRQLVLTHTNAGVESLLRRLRRFGVDRDRAHVDTIHSWCIRYLASYPCTSGGLPTDGTTVKWELVCTAMTKFLAWPVIQDVVRASYAGVFVDEYQDCDQDQHDFIAALAKLLPMRILGDPLQGVFRFAGEPPPWNSVVESEFPNVATLTTPWRWCREGENAELGAWLAEARGTLESKGTLRLDDERIRYIQTPSFRDWGQQAQSCCFKIGQEDGSVVAILKWAEDYLGLGRMTGGFFQCVEPIDAKDGARVLRALEGSAPGDRADVVLRFLRSISSGSKAKIQQVDELRRADSPLGDLDESLTSAVTLLREQKDLVSPAMAAAVIDGVARSPDVKVFRWELLRAVVDSLLDARSVGYDDLVGFLRKRRSLASHIGRRLGRRVAGSTLLLKGMEFDHAVVVDTGKFSVHDLYVALTRGSKSLTVLSPTPAIDVSAMGNQ